MNPPDGEDSTLSTDRPEGTACLPEASDDGTVEESGLPLYRGNLIYLPFAAHLAEDDAAAERKAA